MKQKTAVRLLCSFCKWATRKNTLMVRCIKNPKHNQKQGFSNEVHCEDHNHHETSFNINKECYCPNSARTEYYVSKCMELKSILNNGKMI